MRVGSRVCALRVEAVEETMRPLPVQAIPGTPPFLKGVSIVRGAPVPVVDLALLVGAADAQGAGRFVSLRVGERRVALAVDAVLGVQVLDASRLREAAPLLGSALREVVQAVGAFDRELLLVLDAAGMISDTLWQTLEGAP